MSKEETNFEKYGWVQSEDLFQFRDLLRKGVMSFAESIQEALNKSNEFSSPETFRSFTLEYVNLWCKLLKETLSDTVKEIEAGEVATPNSLSE